MWHLLVGETVSPSKSRYYRCNRTISPYVKKQLEIHEEKWIKMAQSFKSIVVETDGFENVPLLEIDAWNHVDKNEVIKAWRRGCCWIQNYFYKMQAKNDWFFLQSWLGWGGLVKKCIFGRFNKQGQHAETLEILLHLTSHTLRISMTCHLLLLLELIITVILFC